MRFGVRSSSLMKTARFTQVVAKCGKPVVHDQWLPPEKDAALKQAVKSGRIMTVHFHTVGTRKDYGEVGLGEGGQRVLLVFPKSLRAFKDRRIVGISYDLLKEGPPPPKRKTAAQKKPATEPQPPAATPRDSASFLRLFRQSDADESSAEEEGSQTEEDARKPPPAEKGTKRRGRGTARQKAAAKRTSAKKRSSGAKAAQRDKKPRRQTAPPARSEPEADAGADARRLRTEIRKALRQLKAGKAVAAYETLEQALE